MDVLFIKSFLPEIFLSTIILFQLVYNSYLINNINFNFPLLNKEIFLQCFFLLVCLLILFDNQLLHTHLNNFLLISDNTSINVKKIITLISLASIVVVWRSFVIQKINFFEFFSLYFLGLLGILLLTSSYDLISAYLIIELQALSFYILSSFKRTSAFSTESGLKYFIIGSFVSGLFLLGSFLIYVSLGTLNFNTISNLLFFPLTFDVYYLNYSLLLGILLIIVTLFFKTVVAPFHFWAPDVYEGSPLSSTIIFALVPKIALFTFFLRWVSIFVDSFLIVKLTLICVGLFSVFWGAYFAINQKRLKRFIIYSSISQTGFVILGLSSYSYESYSAVFFFLIIYLISSLIIWGVLVSLHFFNLEYIKFDKNIVIRPIFITDLSSYVKINYTLSLVLLILFFSLAGIPPFSGFIAKVLIVLSLVYDNNFLISLFLVLISAVSVYYYLRVIKILFFDTNKYFISSRNYITIDSSSLNMECTILVTCIFFLIFIFFYPSLVILFSNYLTFGFNLI